MCIRDSSKRLRQALLQKALQLPFYKNQQIRTILAVKTGSKIDNTEDTIFPKQVLKMLM